MIWSTHVRRKGDRRQLTNAILSCLVKRYRAPSYIRNRLSDVTRRRQLWGYCVRCTAGKHRNPYYTSSGNNESEIHVGRTVQHFILHVALRTTQWKQFPWQLQFGTNRHMHKCHTFTIWTAHLQGTCEECKRLSTLNFVTAEHKNGSEKRHEISV